MPVGKHHIIFHRVPQGRHGKILKIGCHFFIFLTQSIDKINFEKNKEVIC